MMVGEVEEIRDYIFRRVVGWLTLLKSIFSSLPTNYLSLFTIPTSVANRIEKLQ